mgnify:CR=1 FL=1
MRANLDEAESLLRRPDFVSGGENGKVTGE